MGLFTFITIVVVAGIVGGCYQTTIKSRNKRMSFQGDEFISGLSRINERLDRLESRMSDVETLIIEKDKELKYKDL